MYIIRVKNTVTELNVQHIIDVSYTNRNDYLWIIGMCISNRYENHQLALVNSQGN